MAEKTGKQAAKSPKVFDVAKPGKLPSTSATARPVIISNRPIMQDPMMVSKSDNSEPSSAPVMAPAPKVTIRPMSEQTSESTEELPVTASEPAESSGQADTGASPDSEPSNDSEPAKAEEPERPATEEPADSSKTPDLLDTTAETEASVDDVPPSLDDAGSKNPLAKSDIEAAETAIKQQEEFDKLIEDKTYFLSINAVQRRRSRLAESIGILSALILTILLILLALDAAVVKIPGVQPLTDFI